jgi:Ice-binding-like/PEP-CTERM motif
MRLQSFFRVAFVLVLPLLAASARADTIGIGSAAPFAVLGEAGVMNTGAGTALYGSVAGSTGTPAVTGLVATNVIAPGALILTGVANSGVGTPFGDATIAYNGALAALGPIAEGGNTLGAGGLTSLGPGVYNFSSATSLSGLLELNAGGSNSASWIFQIGTALTTASGSIVEIVNAGGAGAFTGSITWVTGAGDTIGTTTAFLGTIIADTGTLAIGTGATIQCGRAIALDGNVTLNTNTIAVPDCTVASTEGSPGTGFTVSGEVLPPVGGTGSTPTPEPGTFVLLLAGLGGLLAFRKVWGVGSGADCA